MSPVLLALLLTASPSVDLRPRPPAPEDDSVRLYRAPLELLGGAAFGFGVGVAATALACLASHPSGDEDVPPCVVTFFFTAPLAMPLGTYWIGNALDGDGSLAATYVGLLGGAALSGGMALALGNHFDDSRAPGYLALALIVAGPTIGYELSSHAHKQISVVPMITGHARGLALAGTF